MKILITTDCYPPTVNGVVTSVKILEEQLKKNGHEVKVLTLSRKHSSYEENGVTYIASVGVGFVYTDARLKIPFQNKHVTDIIEWKPDVIHSQCEFSTFLFAKHISEEANCPIVHTYHTAYEDYTHYFSPSKKYGRKAVSKFTKWVSGYCETIIAPTQKVYDMLKGYDVKSNVSVVPTGIRLEKFLRDDKALSEKIREKYNLTDKFVAVFIGRIAKEKNIDELINMHEKIENPNIKLLIVGDGPYKEALEKIVEEKNLSDKVIFTGMVPHDEIAAYYKCGDVFVSASTSETQGLTYIEALASGTVVVCRKDDCLVGVVSEGENGFLFENEKEYTDKISYLEENKEKRALMGEGAIKSSLNFSCDEFYKSIIKIYEEAAAHKNKEITELS